MKRFLIKRRLDRQQLAEMAGISLITVHKILNNERHAGRKTAEKLEKVTGIEAPVWVWPERYDLRGRIQEMMEDYDLNHHPR